MKRDKKAEDTHVQCAKEWRKLYRRTFYVCVLFALIVTGVIAGLFRFDLTNEESLQCLTAVIFISLLALVLLLSCVPTIEKIEDLEQVEIYSPEI